MTGEAKNNVFILLGCLVLSFVFFSNGIGGDFVYDDVWVIKSNPTLKQFSSIGGQFLLPYHYQQPNTGIYRPLTLISFILNFLAGDRAFVFHVTNIVLYGLNIFLVFLLIKKLFKSRRLAILSSLFFFFLPIHVEAVTSIVGRAELLSSLFSLLTVLLFFKGRYFVASLAFICALFSKESSIMILPIIFFWSIVTKKSSFKQTIFQSTYLFGATIIYFIFRYLALGRFIFSSESSFVYNPILYVDFWPKVLTALKVLVIYFEHTFIPLKLAADYSFDQIKIVNSLANIYPWLGVMILTVFFWLVLSRRFRSSPLAFGSLLFLCAYIIVSHFFLPLGTIMADRLFFFPSVGLVVIIAFVFDRLVVAGDRAKVVLVTALTVIVCWYGWLILERNKIWANTGFLYQDMVRKSPQSVHAKSLLGAYLIQEGHWPEGKKLLEESYTTYPNHLITLNSLGIVAKYERRLKDAEIFYQKAVELRPTYTPARNNLERIRKILYGDKE